MDAMIAIDVTGTPAPKGSKKAFVNHATGRVVVMDDNHASKKAWHAAVYAAAFQATRGGRSPYRDQPLAIRLTFYLARPKGHYAKRGGLKPSAPRYPSVKPDIDKLARATIDPLEGIVFDGDSRIVVLHASKCYADQGEAGVSIKVWGIDEELAGA
jgi:Holliday junction resolvase RusA-like endonuclease